MFDKFNKAKAFTLSEVLITLGIIGIIAAMTLPSLVGRYQEKVTVTRLKNTIQFSHRLLNVLSMIPRPTPKIGEWEICMTLKAT